MTSIFLRCRVIATTCATRFLYTYLFHHYSMGAGAFVEPLVVITLLFGGTWVNRNADYRLSSRKRVYRRRSSGSSSPDSSSSFESGRSSSSSSVSLLANVDDEPRWRKRELWILGLKKEVISPNTRRFEGYFLSRLLKKFPFLVEAWYWALIYWVRCADPAHATCKVKCTVSSSLF